MMRLVKRLLESRWLKWAVGVIAVGIGAYTIDKEWNQVHHALGEIGLLASFEALLALLVMQFATLRQWQVLLAGLGSPLRTTTAGRRNQGCPKLLQGLLGPIQRQQQFPQLLAGRNDRARRHRQFLDPIFLIRGLPKLLDRLVGMRACR